MKQLVARMRLNAAVKRYREAVAQAVATAFEDPVADHRVRAARIPEARIVQLIAEGVTAEAYAAQLVRRKTIVLDAEKDGVQLTGAIPARAAGRDKT